MSKIFEALQKSEGEVAQEALPVLTDGGSQLGGAKVVDKILRETTGERRPADASDGAAEDLPAAATAIDVAGLESARRAAAETVEAVPGIRTVALHLSVETPVLPFDVRDGRAGEQYRTARTKLLHHPRQPRLVVISSAGSGDGKTVTSINLAGAMSLKTEAEILLIDADLRKAQIAPLLGISGEPGLADVLMGTCRLEDAIVRLEQFPNLCVLPSGKPTAHPTELLDSNRWTALCASVRQQFKFVILDTPPIAAVADYDLIDAQCDGVVLVVRPDHTDRKLCMQAIDIVPKDRLLGVVLNCVRDWFLWKTQDYYSYTEN